MKKIIIFFMLCVSLSFSQTQAGLFEYYLGQEVKTNATKNEAVDAVDSSKYSHPNAVDSYPSTTYSSSSNYYDSSRNYTQRYSYYSDCSNDWRYSNAGQDCDTYIWYNSHSGDFFRRQDLLNMYENEEEKIEEEIDTIKDIISDIKKEIRDLKRYTSSYYHSLRRQLENDVEYFEDREDDLEDMLDEIQDEMRDIRNSRSGYNSYYYNYYIPRHSYERGSYYPRYYDAHRVPINKDLQDVRDGRVYIK